MPIPFSKIGIFLISSIYLQSILHETLSNQSRNNKNVEFRVLHGHCYKSKDTKGSISYEKLAYKQFL